MLKTIVGFISCCIFFSAFATDVITKTEFIDKILSQQHYLTKDKIYLDIKRLELDASFDSYTNFSPQFTTEFKNEHYNIQKDTNSTSIYEQKRKKNSQKISITAAKKFIDHRGYFNFSASKTFPSNDITRYKQDDFYNFYEVDTYDNNYAISYTYPFLKDSNGASLKTYKRNILDLEREQLDYLDSKEEIVVDRLEDYITFVKYQEKDKVYQEYLQLLKNIQTNNATHSNKLDTELYLANKDIVINMSKLSAMRYKLSAFTTDNIFLTSQLEADYNINANIISNTTEYLQHSSRSLLKLAIDKKLKQIDIAYYQNRQLSALDLKISGERNTNAGNTLTTNYDNKSMEYTSSIVYSLPLFGDINNNKNLTVARLNLEKLSIDYNNKLTDILADIDSYTTNIMQIEFTLNDYPEFIRNMSANIKHLTTQYNNQVVAYATLLDAYEQQRDVKLDYVDLMIEHQEYLLEYDNILDRVVY